jgi:8-oxo-dGTP diphosphatase
MIEKNVVAAILHNAEGEVLLQLRDDKPDLLYANHWTLFGGGVEEGETPETAIHRELMEELEISLPLTFWKKYRCPIRSVEGIVTTHNHIFVGKMTRDIATMRLNEGQAMCYFKPTEAKSLKLAFEQQLILNEFLKNNGFKDESNN